MNKEILNKLAGAKLRTVKAQMIVTALQDGTATRGNHLMLSDMEASSSTVTMYYRHTPIAKVTINTSTWEVKPIHAKEFENTAATMRQRRDFEVAVSELVGVVKQ